MGSRTPDLYFLHQAGAHGPRPGNPVVDFISSELAARIIVSASLQTNSSVPLLHVSATPDAAPLSGFLISSPNASGVFTMAESWRIQQTADCGRNHLSAVPELDRAQQGSLFNQVLACTESFLPGLLFPKTYSTVSARQVLGAPYQLCRGENRAL
jgi:hypothetical protein